jgi:hypothetical protein
MTAALVVRHNAVPVSTYEFRISNNNLFTKASHI